MQLAKGTTEKMWRKALGITAVLVFLGFGAVVVSLFRWQILRGEEMSTAALDQSLTSTTLNAMRGTIYDATGKVLAQSASVWTVVLEPAYLADDEDLRRTVARGLAQILEMDEESIYEMTGDGSSYYTVLKRQIETDARDAINAFLEENEISAGVRLRISSGKPDTLKDITAARIFFSSPSCGPESSPLSKRRRSPSGSMASRISFFCCRLFSS